MRQSCKDSSFSQEHSFNISRMTMSFLPYDAIEPVSQQESFTGSPSNRALTGPALLYFSAKRVQVPTVRNVMKRPRVDVLLSSSEKQFPATLVCGRSGTGKTVLAAEYSGLQTRASWFSIEPMDVDWRSFAAGLTAAMRKRRGRSARPEVVDPDTADTNEYSIETIAAFLERLFRRTRSFPSLIVLDDVHHLFDTVWFGTFFEQLIALTPPGTHVLLLSRSKPPTPLWRMRSKRVLNVIDEKVYCFTEAETVELFLSIGLSQSSARAAFRSGFGNIAQMLRVATMLRKTGAIK